MQTTSEVTKKGQSIGPQKYRRSRYETKAATISARRKATAAAPEKTPKSVTAKKRLTLKGDEGVAISVIPLQPKPLVEYVYKKKRIPKTNPPEYVIERKIGVLFASVNDDGNIGIGFSVCHSTKDRYDYIRGIIHKPGHGLEMAKERAERWAHRGFYEPLPDIFDPDFKDVVRIPTMIQIQLKHFIERCVRYYKGREIPEWAHAFSTDFTNILNSIRNEKK